MKNFFHRVASAVIAFKSGVSPADWLRGQGGSSDSGSNLTSAYEQSVWVYACVEAIADKVAGIPFRISRGERGGEDVIDSGDLVNLFANPHPQLDQNNFIKLLVQWSLIRGEMFAVPTTDEDVVVSLGPTGTAGREGQFINRMVVLSPSLFSEIVQDNALEGWRYSGMGTQSPLKSQVLLPSEVRYGRMSNPYNFWRGMNPLTVAWLAAATDYATANFMKGLMLNNGDQGLIVTSDQWPSAEQRETIFAALAARKRRAGTADRPLILGGGLKVEKPTIASADMQALENRKYNRQEICAVYRTPQEVLGFTEDANRSVGETSKLNWIDNTIEPVCRRLEAFFDPIVKQFGLDLFGWFDIDSLSERQAARRSRVDTALKMFNMAVPFNDINEVLDLGLPKYKWHNQGYLSYALMPVGTKSVLMQEEEEPTKAPAPAEDTEKSSPIERALALLKNASSPAPVPVHTCSAQAGEYAASIAGSVKLMKGKLSKFFFQQRNRVLEQLEKETAKLAPEMERKAVDDVFDLAGENEKLLARLKPLLVADLEFGGAQLFAELGMDNFQLKPQAAMEFLKVRENYIQEINQTTFDQITASLREGLDEGESYEKLAARVKEIFQDATDQRAESIALTETNIAINSGRMEGMRSAKVEKKGWGASQLEGVRATHLRAELDYKDGIPLAEPFHVGGSKLDHPGDPKGPPQEIINCRCFTFAVLNSKAVLPVKMMHFDDWLPIRAAQLSGGQNL